MPDKKKLSKEKRYNRLNLIFSIAEFVVGIVFLIIILVTGITSTLENYIRVYVSNDYLVLLLFVLLLGIAETVILFPISFYSGFILEHQFDLSNQSFGAWIWEKIKGLLISAPLLIIILIVFYALLKNFPVYWWFILGTVLLLFSVIFARIAPVLIFPLFYKFEKLKDDELAKKVSDLCIQVGMKLQGVFQFNLSKNTKKGNAAFTGMGKSKRVILGDTLLDKLDDNEILAVLAHELGHYKLKHIWKSIGLSIVMTYTGLFLVSRIYNEIYPVFGDNIWTIAAIPLIALILTLYEFITSPIINAFSRSNECEADDFAIKMMGESNSFILGLNKLSEQNLSDRDPHPLTVFFFYSHPPIEQRIKRLQK